MPVPAGCRLFLAYKQVRFFVELPAGRRLGMCRPGRLPVASTGPASGDEIGRRSRLGPSCRSQHFPTCAEPSVAAQHGIVGPAYILRIGPARALAFIQGQLVGRRHPGSDGSQRLRTAGPMPLRSLPVGRIGARRDCVLYSASR